MGVPHIKYIVDSAIHRIDCELSVFADEVVESESESVLNAAHIVVASLLEDMDKQIEAIGGYLE